MSLPALSDMVQRTCRSPSLETEDTEAEGGLCSRNPTKLSYSKINGCFLLSSRNHQLTKDSLKTEDRMMWQDGFGVCGAPGHSRQSPAS